MHGCYAVLHFIKLLQQKFSYSSKVYCHTSFKDPKIMYHMWLVTPGITLIKGFVNLSDLVQKFKGAQIYTQSMAI